MSQTYRLISLLTLVIMSLALVSCAGTDTSRSTGTYIDDKTISTKVKTQLATDSMTKALQIEVETYNGVVQLSGFVEKEQFIDRAEEIARSVDGVKKINNDLILRE